MFCTPIYLLLQPQQSPFFYVQVIPLPLSPETQIEEPKNYRPNNVSRLSNEIMKESFSSIKKHNLIGIQKKSSKKPTKFIQGINNNKCEENQQDQQFNPNDFPPKRDNKGLQNQNRNIIPNIIHQVISYLQKKGKSQKKVEKLMLKLQPPANYSSKRFYYYQLLLKDKWNHYVNPESLLMFKKIHISLIEIFSQQEQECYNEISRTLVHYFLSKEFNSSILTSKRVNCQKKLDHLMAKRKVLEEITEVYRK